MTDEEKSKVRSIRFPTDLLKMATIRAEQLNKSFNSYIQSLAEKDITRSLKKKF